jgi:hypothetical protein
MIAANVLHIAADGPKRQVNQCREIRCSSPSRRRRSDAIQSAENIARVLGADSRSSRAAGDPMRVKPCRKYSRGSSAVENWAIAKSRTRKNLTERIDYQPTFQRGAT